MKRVSVLYQRSLKKPNQFRVEFVLQKKRVSILSIIGKNPNPFKVDFFLPNTISLTIGFPDKY